MNELLGPDARRCHRALTGEHGVSLPAFRDHHVHLHLIDEHALPAGGIASVVDLGGDAAQLARRPHDSMPHAEYAGAFLTAPGGYPSGRPWAPAAIVREVHDASTHPGIPGGAATAVDDQAAFGASVIKVALNAATGPVLAPDVLAAIVACAAERGLPVVAHVEGERMLRRALRAGVAALAHTPFTEEADDAVIARALALGQRWISTLSIHEGADLERATANLAAFARAGGRVLYGTDLGNGDRTPGIDAEELARLDAAGIRGAALVAALTDPWPAADGIRGVATFIPGEPPATLDEVPGWLAGATVVPTEELIHDDH